ncbi:MAG: hypothetical protein HYW97_01560 [Candidatus Wildermuthbacteria bacterium]|nr:hypothetical protein [Candidatus Wildermuthbacteria bacterium]
MKYSARLVTALAAVALLVVALIALSPKAQAATSPPAPDMAMASVVQSIDPPAVLDLEGGGTDVLAVTTQIDATFDDPTTPAFTLVAEHDVGTLDTSLVLVVHQTDDLAAPQVAAMISTGSDDNTAPGIGVTVGALALLIGPIGGYFAWRNRKHARDHAPIATSVVEGVSDDMTGATREGGADATSASQSGTSYNPRV